MLFVSTAGALASTVYAYVRQKKCKPGEVRLRGRLYANPRKTVMADVIEVFVNDEKYFMRCSVPGLEGIQIIAIDKAMMAALPDSRAKSKDCPLAQVMLYVEDTPDGPACSLAPEEIRFKTNLQFIQSETKEVDIAAAAKAVGFWYEIRLVLFTIAWLGIYQAPHISLILSALAAIISWRNVIPLRYTSLADCGFTSSKKDPIEAAPAAKAKKEELVPPGYENWTAERKYLYSLEKKMEKQRENDAAPAEPDADVTAAESAPPAVPEPELMDAAPAADTEPDTEDEEPDSFMSALGLDEAADDEPEQPGDGPSDDMPDDGEDDTYDTGADDLDDVDGLDEPNELDAALGEETEGDPEEAGDAPEPAESQERRRNRGRHGGRKKPKKGNVADLLSETLG